MSKSKKNLLSSPSEEQSSLRSPLVTPSSGNRHDATRQIDVVRLVNNQEQSRVTTVNLNAYRPYKRIKKESRISGIQSANLRSDQQEDHEEYILPSEGGGDHHKMARFSRLSQHQTFIGSYQNNHVIGTIMYLLFILFIAAQALAAAYITPKPQDSTRFQLQKTMIIIWSAECLCYLLMRYLNAKTDTKFIKKSTILGSIKKVFALQAHHSFVTSSRSTNPSLYIVILVVSLILGQIVYCVLLSFCSLLTDTSGQGYMIATIFWSNFALPFLFQNFYISEISYRKNFKLKIFPYIIFLFMLQSFLQSYLFFLLAAFKLINIYTYTKQGYQIFHIDFLVKAIGLGTLVILSIIKYYILDSGDPFTAHMLGSIAHTLVKIAIVAGAMLTSRVVALHFLKLELYKYFYTQMHVQLGYVIATMLLYIAYINFMDFQLSFELIQIILGLVFLGVVGILVYLEGTQKMQVNMDLINEQH